MQCLRSYFEIVRYCQYLCVRVYALHHVETSFPICNSHVPAILPTCQPLIDFPALGTIKGWKKIAWNKELEISGMREDMWYPTMPQPHRPAVCFFQTLIPFTPLRPITNMSAARYSKTTLSCRRKLQLLKNESAFKFWKLMTLQKIIWKLFPPLESESEIIESVVKF